MIKNKLNEIIKQSYDHRKIYDIKHHLLVDFEEFMIDIQQIQYVFVIKGP